MSGNISYIIGIVQCQFYIDKEKVDISSAKTNTNNNSGTSSNEWGKPRSFYIICFLTNYNIFKHKNYN